MSEEISKSVAPNVRKLEDLGLITVKAEFHAKTARVLVEGTTGIDFPAVGSINSGKKMSVGWMSTDECLIITDHSSVKKIVQKLETKLGRQHNFCCDISDSRCCFELSGQGWREILAKGSPADVSPETFKIGVFRRTRIRNLAVAFWMTSENYVRLICMRSVSDYMNEWLQTAVESSGRLNYF